MKQLKYNLSTADESAEIYIYDAIGQNPWSEGVTPKDVADLMKKFKDVKTITVRINSPGGNAFDGQAIYTMLHTSDKKIAVKIDGLAASAAATIAMAGDDIEIAEGAELMIHRAMGGVFGYAPDLRKEADLLDQVSGDIAGIYAARTGQPLETIMDLMEAETWMNADDAKQAGFVTKVTKAKKVAACFDLAKWNYKHAPMPVEKTQKQIFKERIAALRGQAV
jgi:ATP-dependent Clp protease, protease subunit